MPWGRSQQPWSLFFYTLHATTLSCNLSYLDLIINLMIWGQFNFSWSNLENNIRCWIFIKNHETTTLFFNDTIFHSGLSPLCVGINLCLRLCFKTARVSNLLKLHFAWLVQFSRMYIFVILQESQNGTYDVLHKPVKIHVQMCTHYYFYFL